MAASLCLQLVQIDRPLTIDNLGSLEISLDVVVPCSCNRHTNALIKLPRHNPKTISRIISINTMVTYNVNRLRRESVYITILYFFKFLLFSFLLYSAWIQSQVQLPLDGSTVYISATCRMFVAACNAGAVPAAAGH